MVKVLTMPKVSPASTWGAEPDIRLSVPTVLTTKPCDTLHPRPSFYLLSWHNY